MTFLSSLPVRARCCSARSLKVLSSLGFAALLAACANTPLPPHEPPQTPSPGATAPSQAAAPQLPRVQTPHAPLSEISIASATPPPVTMLAAPADIWERIRRGLAMQDLDGELVRDREQWYASRPDYIQRMTERSSRYLFHIVEEIERRNLPMELALLPFIESAFNPQAVSSARAAGMWQFMPATGQSFDLKQNVFRDDRRDVLASTRAALDYLEQLHARFGDWHLALAAYNWGQGNVRRAIERNQAAGLGTGYNDLNMPAETRNYVPKLQAVKNIIASPQQFGSVLPLIENHPFFDTVDITNDIDVETAARLADVRLEDFRALNPSQRKPVIFATGTPQILLPWNNADIFKKNLAAAAPGSLASWTAWVAPSNLPSREVASRFGMNEDDFREMNNIPRGMVIKSGSTVLVRRNGQGAGAVAEHVVNNARLAYTPEIVLRRTSVRARRGDSIATIAARYDLPAATVAGWNKMGARAGLKRGQAVVLYLPVRASAAAARDNAETARSERGESRAARSSARGNARAEQAPKGKAGSTRAAKGRDSADRRAQPAGKKAAPARAQPAASKKPVARTGSAKPAPKAAAKPKANTRR